MRIFHMVSLNGNIDGIYKKIKKIKMKMKARYKDIFLLPRITKGGYYLNIDKGDTVCNVSVHDFMLRQMVDGELMRYDIVVRLLAIEQYFGLNEFGFELYKKMQIKRIGCEQAENALDKFCDLIKSYEQNGYDNQYPILVDESLSLVDGSHRVALALYSNTDYLRIMIYKVDYPVEYSRDWFVLNDFTNEEIKRITDKAKDIEKSFLITKITCVIWPPAFQFVDRIKEMIQYYGTVDFEEAFSFGEMEFEKLIKLIYSVDDILQWKVNKKIEYIKNNISGRYNVYYMVVKISNPRYRLKLKKYTPLSIIGERIKKTVRNVIKDEVENYFFDIVLHTSDNDLQAKFIEHCFYPDIRVMDILNYINKYEYVLLKNDVPYMPVDFPEKIPIGKDLDILTTVEDFSEVINIIKKTVCNLKYYEIKELNNDNHTRIRLEKFGHLFYQFDICCYVEGLNSKFVEDIIRTRVKKNNYYIPLIPFEMIIREIDYRENPEKKWHLDFIHHNKQSYDESMWTIYFKQ